jgi:ribose-phosphate pyrophosphokinase
MYGELSIFSGRANPQLAEEICDYLNIPLRGADILDFPNENIFVKLNRSVRQQDVFLVQPASSPVNRNILELLIMIDTLKRASAGRITAVIPFYPYARTDKKDQPRVPITARLMADLITAAGADRILTVDLHAEQIQGFFNIPVDEVTALHLLSDYFIQKNLDMPVVIAPDVGATKKARNFAQELNVPLAIIEKRRLGNEGKSEALNIIGQVRGHNAVIFDDEIDTAGSILQATTVLRENGVNDIYTCCTHPVLSPPATERISSMALKELVVTNTLPIPPEKRLDNITVISIAPLLGEVIRRIHLGVSVGEMFNE